MLRHDTLKLIDGADPDALAPSVNKAEEPSANGKEPEGHPASENERCDPPQPLEQAKEPVQTSTSPKCPFSRTVLSIDLKRFTESSVPSVECPRCGRTRSLTPVKGVLRFPPHEPRKIQTDARGKRWSTTGKTDWGMVGE